MSEPLLSEPITGRVDRDLRLIAADPALLRLQLHAGAGGGDELAIPQLATLCRLSARLGMRLARTILAADDSHAIRLRVETVPENDHVAFAIVGWEEQERSAHAGLETAASLHRQVEAEEGASFQLDAGLRILSATGLSDGEAADRAIGHPLTAFLTLHAADDGSLPMLDAVAERQPFAGQKALLKGKDRLLSGTPLFDGNGDFAGYLCRLTDRGDPRGPGVGGEPAPATLLGERLAPALRQPLSRIIANAETIGGQLRGPIRQSYAGYAMDIADAARHLMELVEDVGDLEAIERVDFHPVADEIDLAELSRRAAGLLAVKAADHRIAIVLPDETAVAPAVGEFRRVLQILVNLIGNAIRYCPDGSRIELSVGVENNVASIVVADNGQGITPDSLDMIFDKFERLGRLDGGGSGLGLYISRRLARAMDGDLTVESKPGEGSRFTLSLPPRASR